MLDQIIMAIGFLRVVKKKTELCFKCIQKRYIAFYNNNKSTVGTFLRQMMNEIIIKSIFNCYMYSMLPIISICVDVLKNGNVINVIGTRYWY